MRAGDGDRQQVADQLKAALDEGRLDLSEYDERVQRAYGAKTYGDLDGLLDDLPGTVPVTKSQVMPAAAPEPPTAHGSVHKKAKHQGKSGGVQGMAFVFVICVFVWLMGGAGYFWPGWVLIPLAFAVMAHFKDRGNRGH
ncbi:DUF1707 domain-containing protein [Actinoplanes couchii]|uniref:DUF1707 domain-containing protein n=1 Tax=Actinoplanes couchii TaxID=403638 RepID=A0ABQ3XC70_9ACTN|nr:hypothetical protein Aco03nite_045140 [Actinoplanes couchii]